MLKDSNGLPDQWWYWNVRPLGWCSPCINTFAYHETKKKEQNQKGFNFGIVSMCAWMCRGGILGRIQFICMCVFWVCMRLGFLQYIHIAPNLEVVVKANCHDNNLKSAWSKTHGNIEMIIVTPYLCAVRFLESSARISNHHWNAISSIYLSTDRCDIELHRTPFLWIAKILVFNAIFSAFLIACIPYILKWNCVYRCKK